MIFPFCWPNWLTIDVTQTNSSTLEPESIYFLNFFYFRIRYKYVEHSTLISEALRMLTFLSSQYHGTTSLNFKKGILLALAAAAIGFGRDAKPFLTGKF